ncbi:MAG: hypothetical protein ACFBWO_00490 [Paracoccaceae bacterium]
MSAAPAWSWADVEPAEGDDAATEPARPCARQPDDIAGPRPEPECLRTLPPGNVALPRLRPEPAGMETFPSGPAMSEPLAPRHR